MRHWMTICDDLTKLYEALSPAFRQWFGDSKVVDAAGHPLKVYHGTPDVRHILQHGFRSSLMRGHVYFFSDDYAVADSYADDRRAFDYQNAEPHTIPVYLAIHNPFVIDAKGKNWRDTEKHIEQARAGGHDGLIIKASRDEYNAMKTGGRLSTVYAVFDPTQIRSALTANVTSRIDKADLGRGDPERYPAMDP